MKLSILIPAYNVEKYIEKCIDSIICQIDDNIEVIIINDGSTDNTPKILEKYRSNNIIIITQDNKGVAFTRNRLLQEAKGEYIWFIDADDFISKDALNNIINISGNNSDELFLLGYQHVNNDLIPFAKKEFKEKNTPGYLIVNNKIYENVLWNKVIKLSVIKDHNLTFDNFTTGEDFIFCYKLLTFISSLNSIKTICYNYRLTQNSICQKRDKLHMKVLYDNSISQIQLINNFNKQLPKDISDVMYLWFRHFIEGFFFSLIRFKEYSINDLNYAIDVIKSENLYPLKKYEISDIKEKFFLRIINSRSLIVILKVLFRIKD
ncbi:MAG: glycosyltransferase family A protein [Bacteroidales bacterium]|nr:glycosyltransferase family A protein [Bacteroidales bacterium]